MLKRIVAMLTLFALAIPSSIAVADEKASGVIEIEDPNASILELQRQMAEMQKKHDAEINALKEQIEQTNIEQPLFPDVSKDNGDK